MIEFSARIAAIIANPKASFFYMARAANYRTTSHYSDIELSNGEIFLADGRLVAVDPPRISSQVDRELYKIALSDTDFTFSEQAALNLVGKPYTIRMGFIDPDTNEPLTDIIDTLVMYDGIIDNSAYQIETGNIGSATFAISGASPLADLDAIRAFRTSKEFIRNLNPTDNSFDQIYDGSGPVNLKWGKG